jgi:competence protein ComEA
MIQSLLIKLGMLAGTIMVVFWIGWTIPATPDQRTTATPTTSQTTPTSPVHESGVAQDAGTPVSALKLQEREKLQRVPGRLDLNRATVSDFESLPGIGPVLAKRIVEYRMANGPFQTVEQLQRVKGIGAKKFEQVRPLLNVTPEAKPAKGGQGAA